MIQPVFEKIYEAIFDKINNASKSIKIIMAWFTDEDLFNLLLKKAKEGVHIELILMNHLSSKKKRYEPNNVGIKQFERFKLDLNRLQDSDIAVTLVDEATEFFLHSKFCIIDSNCVITGSYNWSYPARRNIENIVIITDIDATKKYHTEFQRIKDKKHQILLNLERLPKCKICDELAVKIRIYDYYGNTDEFHDEIKDIMFCINDPVEHLEILDELEDYHLELGELMKYEYEKLDHEFEFNNNISKEKWDQRIRNAIAKHFGSTNDLFLENAKNDLFIIAKRTSDVYFDDEFPTFKIIWNNELFDDFAAMFVDWSSELNEAIYS